MENITAKTDGNGKKKGFTKKKPDKTFLQPNNWLEILQELQEKKLHKTKVN